MKKIILVIGILILVLGMAGCGSGKGDEKMKYTHMNMTDAKNMMAELDEAGTEYIILDVRTPEEFADMHIPDAINIANETISDNEIAALPDKDKTIFVYCRSGNRSTQSAKKLVNLGYTNIIEMGGIGDWPGDLIRE